MRGAPQPENETAWGAPPCRGCGRGAPRPPRSALKTYDHKTNTYACHRCVRQPQPKLKLTCRECGAAREATRHYVQDAIRVRQSGRVTVDWEAGTAVHTCRQCANRALMTARNAAALKRRGRQVLRDRGKRLTAWNAAHPEEHRAHAKAATAARLVKQRSQQRSELDVARWRLGNLHLDLNGILSLCELCHRLMFTPAAVVRRWQAEGREHFGRFHRRCLLTWRGSAEMRAWVSACRRAGAAGQPKPEMPVPPRPANRMSSTHELVEGYVATVRYFWQKEGRGLADRDEHGEPRSVVWLAQEGLHVSHKTLYLRVKRFLSLLPDEAVATGPIANWRAIFLTLADAQDGANPKTTQVAQPPEPNTTQVAHP